MKSSRYRWFVLAALFAFMLLHQSDKLLIGPLTTPIMQTFGIDEAQIYITGTLGVVLAFVIFVGVREAPGGQSEPELAGLAEVGVYRFNWATAMGLFKKHTLLILFVQGFFGVFPWNTIMT